MQNRETVFDICVKLEFYFHDIFDFSKGKYFVVRSANKFGTYFGLNFIGDDILCVTDVMCIMSIWHNVYIFIIVHIFS